MSHYLQVLQSPLTRDRIALIPQDKKAIALSILKLRKNPSDSHSRSIIREQMMATTDFKERRELERILSFAECPVYSDTQKGHLEMAQNIGFHWANKIIAKHGESVIDLFASDFDLDIRDKSRHEGFKDEFVDRLNNYFENISPDLLNTQKAILSKIGELDGLIGSIKYDDWTDDSPADTRFQESVLNRFWDYTNENFGLIAKEIHQKQSSKREEIIKTSTSQLDKLAKDTAFGAIDNLLSGKIGSAIIKDIATGYDYKDLTDEDITDILTDHLSSYINELSDKRKLASQLETIENRLDEHLDDTTSFEIFEGRATEYLKESISSKMGDIRKEIYARYLPIKRQENRENAGIDNARLKNKNKLTIEAFVEDPKDIPDVLQQAGKWKKNESGYYQSVIDTTGKPGLHKSAQRLRREGAIEVKNWEFTEYFSFGD